MFESIDGNTQLDVEGQVNLLLPLSYWSWRDSAAVKAHTALPQDPNSVPSTISNSSFRGYLWLLWTPALIRT